MNAAPEAAQLLEICQLSHTDPRPQNKNMKHPSHPIIAGLAALLGVIVTQLLPWRIGVIHHRLSPRGRFAVKDWQQIEQQANSGDALAALKLAMYYRYAPGASNPEATRIHQSLTQQWLQKAATLGSEQAKYELQVAAGASANKAASKP